MKKIFILLLLLFILNSVNAQLLKNNICDRSTYSITELQNDNRGITKRLYLNKANGNLTIYGTASKSPYEVYFILPIAFREQAPVWLDIQCPEMVDYRFIRLDQFNVFVAAQLNNSSDTIHLNWTSWVIAKQHDYSGIPSTVPIPALNELPDSVKTWLKPTGCVQWEDPFVKHIADSIRGTTNDLIVLANRIRDYCYNIPWVWPTVPISWDAYYAMKWGNSCTGHAHAGAAIFRENGIPCRVLLNMPTWDVGCFDMHWIIEYYVPQYGWVKMETSIGKNPYLYAHQEMITFACNPEDEFSMIFPDNIESFCFASDTVFQHFYPDWNGAHSGNQYCFVTDTVAKVDSIISLTDSVYKYFTTYQGINLTSAQTTYFQTAQDFQYKAFNYIKSGKKDSLIYYLNKSLDNYRNVEINPLQTIFFDNFENGTNGWTHGGVNDEWELGTPTNVGPDSAYSGNNCWGTDLDSLYKNNADCWLLSPSINLNNLSSAYLSVKIWNDVEDSLQGYSPKDKLWIELSTDNGATFFPITTHLGGVIDFNTGVPQVGGWSRLVLDLTPYIGSTIKIRFHFTSNFSISRPGSYIDNVFLYGREMNIAGIAKNETLDHSIIIYPNPTKTQITVELQKAEKNCTFSIYNVNGQEVFKQKINERKTQIDISSLASGVYFVKLFLNKIVEMQKIIKE